MDLIRIIFYNSLAIKCKLGLLGGSLIPSLCQTRPINSETEDFVRQAVDGLGERDSPSRLPLEPPYFFFDMASEILPFSVLMR